MKRGNISITTLATGADTTRLLLEGQLIIRNANAIKNELIPALNGSQNLEIVCKNITKIDMTFLQILIALQKSASTLKKKLSLDIESNDYMKTLLRNSGLENLFIPDFKIRTNGIH